MGFWCNLLELIINHKVKVNLKNEHGFQNVLVFWDCINDKGFDVQRSSHGQCHMFDLVSENSAKY